MIRIFGAINSPEYIASLQLQELFLAEHPMLANSDSDQVTIIAGAKCHGQPVRDLDIVVLANFDPQLSYQPVLSFANPLRPGQPETPPLAKIESVCAVIEIKDHSADAVRFFGSTAEVKYQSHWHNVTEQSDKQIYALRNYLLIKGLPTP